MNEFILYMLVFACTPVLAGFVIATFIYYKRPLNEKIIKGLDLWTSKR